MPDNTLYYGDNLEVLRLHIKEEAKIMVMEYLEGKQAGVEIRLEELHLI